MIFVGMLVVRICLLYVAGAVTVQNIRKFKFDHLSPISFFLAAFISHLFPLIFPFEDELLNITTARYY